MNDRGLVEAPRGLVRVERTLLSAAFDSSPEKREWSRSNPTGQQPDARTREFIPPFGDATQSKSEWLAARPIAKRRAGSQAARAALSQPHFSTQYPASRPCRTASITICFPS